MVKLATTPKCRFCKSRSKVHYREISNVIICECCFQDIHYIDLDFFLCEIKKKGSCSYIKKGYGSSKNMLQKRGYSYSRKIGHSSSKKRYYSFYKRKDVMMREETVYANNNTCKENAEAAKAKRDAITLQEWDDITVLDVFLWVLAISEVCIFFACIAKFFGKVWS